MEQLQTRSEERLAQALVAVEARARGRRLSATLAAAAARIARSRDVPPLLRGPLLLRVLRILRQEEKLLEEYFISAVPHPGCPPAPWPVDRDLEELWGLPQDDWVCRRCGNPLYSIIPFEEDQFPHSEMVNVKPKRKVKSSQRNCKTLCSGKPATAITKRHVKKTSAGFRSIQQESSRIKNAAGLQSLAASVTIANHWYAFRK